LPKFKKATEVACTKKTATLLAECRRFLIVLKTQYLKKITNIDLTSHENCSRLWRFIAGQIEALPGFIHR
jgi:hypothetical protein